MTPEEKQRQIAQWMDDITKVNLMMKRIEDQEQQLRDEGVVLDHEALARVMGERAEIRRIANTIGGWIKDVNK